jgi:hypothetical protein
VVGFHEGAAIGAGRAARKRFPIAPQLAQAVGAHAPEQDIIGRRVLRVQLQTAALEPLDLSRAAFDQLGLLWRDRQAEGHQPAIALPEIAERAGDAVARRGEAARAGLGLRGGGARCHKQAAEGEQSDREMARSIVHDRLLLGSSGTGGNGASTGTPRLTLNSSGVWPLRQPCGGSLIDVEFEQRVYHS